MICRSSVQKALPSGPWCESLAAIPPRGALLSPWTQAPQRRSYPPSRHLRRWSRMPWYCPWCLRLRAMRNG